MGNQNVSGLQKEDDNTPIEVTEKSFQESVHEDDLTGENQIIHVAEENVETEVQVVPNDAGDEEVEIQPAQNVEDHEKPIESNSEESVSETSNHQIQKVISTIKVTEKEQDEDDTRTSNFDTNSILHNFEVVEYTEPVSGQHELAITHADPSVDDHTGLPQGSEEAQGSNITGNTDDESDLLAEYIDSEANMQTGESELLEKIIVSQQDKFDIVDGNEPAILVGKIVINGFEKLNSSVKPQDEVSEIEDKCMVLTDETKLIPNETEFSNLEHSSSELYNECLNTDTELTGIELENNKLDEIPFQFFDKLVKGSNTNTIDEASPSESMKSEICGENIVKERIEDPFESDVIEEREQIEVDTNPNNEDIEEIKVTEEQNVEQSEMMIAEIVVSTVESENEKPSQDLSQCFQSKEQCVKEETSIRESVPIRRSPSFNFDILVEAMAEESDQTPLLYTKPTTTSFESRIGNNIITPIENTYYSQDPINCDPISVGEKNILHEQIDCEKSRTPFLSFLKKEKDAHILVSANNAPENMQKFIDEEVASTSPKTREKKRKPRSSLFTSCCMCCAAMID